MIWLSSSTIARLRDQLRARGSRPSIPVADPTASPAELELAAVDAEYGPLCEAMYLMMTADGSISAAEREVLKGALRNLSSDSIRSIHIEAMLEQAEARVKAQGRDARFSQIAAALAQDRARGEVAYVLAASIAFADSAIADQENETLNALGEKLGIDDDRANELLDAVEHDLRADAASK